MEERPGGSNEPQPGGSNQQQQQQPGGSNQVPEQQMQQQPNENQNQAQPQPNQAQQQPIGNQNQPQPNANNPQQQQQQGGREHLWYLRGMQQGPEAFERHQNRLRQIWQREHRIRQQWMQEIQRWQQHRENENDLDQSPPPQEQELPELRSRHNRHSSFIRFINTVPVYINVYWIDYQGNKVFYKTLALNDYLDINTFVTHPWIFVDAKTHMRYPADGQFVYFPEAWYVKYNGQKREELPSRIERTNVFIRRPMRSLRDLCLYTISYRLKTGPDAFQLELPRVLQRELYELQQPDKELA